MFIRGERRSAVRNLAVLAPADTHGSHGIANVGLLSHTTGKSNMQF